MLHFLNRNLLFLNLLNLLFQRSCLLLFLLRLYGELFQSLLFPFHLELCHGQMFLRTSSFSTLHIRISGIAHGLEEIILEDTVRLPQYRLAILLENRHTLFIQCRFGQPFFTAAYLHNRFFDGSHK